MRAGKNTITGESEIYLTQDEADLMKEMVRGSHLPIKQYFNELLSKI